MPDRVTAGWNNLLCSLTTGIDPQKNEKYVDIGFMGLKGGSGAMRGTDGYDHIGMIDASGGVLDQDYEMFEQQTPHRLIKHEYLADSAGPGEWRGGLGVETIFEIGSDDTQLVTFGDGDFEPAFGLFGGGAGTLNFIRLHLSGRQGRGAAEQGPDHRRAQGHDLPSAGRRRRRLWRSEAAIAPSSGRGARRTHLARGRGQAVWSIRWTRNSHRQERPLAPPGEDITVVQTYEAPRSLAEAVALLRAGNVTIVAGGTDLMPQSKTGRARFQPVLMNIRRIPELRGIGETDGCVRFGALTTVTELLDSVMVKTRFNALWQAADHFASDQLRNAATIGGNICNASPAGDTLVPLLVFNARVVLASEANGALDDADACRSPRSSSGLAARSARPTELLTAVDVPLPPDGFVSEFHKFGTRPALDIATIAIGLGAVRDGDRLRDVRVAFGAVAPTPIRAPKTEAALDGKLLSAAIEPALAAADAGHSPDHRHSRLGLVSARARAQCLEKDAGPCR